jgi:hypothetical protein
MERWRLIAVSRMEQESEERSGWIERKGLIRKVEIAALRL